MEDTFVWEVVLVHQGRRQRDGTNHGYFSLPDNRNAAIFNTQLHLVSFIWVDSLK